MSSLSYLCVPGKSNAYRIISWTEREEMAQSQSPWVYLEISNLSVWCLTLSIFWTPCLKYDTHYLWTPKGWAALLLLFCHLKYILHVFRLRWTPLHTNHCPGGASLGPSTTSMLRSQLQLKQHILQWHFLASLGILTVIWCLNYQLFSIISTCVQNQYNVGEPCTLTNSDTNLKCNHVPLDYCFSMLTLRKKTPRRFCLNDIGLLLFTCNILSLVN